VLNLPHGTVPTVLFCLLAGAVVAGGSGNSKYATLYADLFLLGVLA